MDTKYAEDRAGLRIGSCGSVNWGIVELTTLATLIVVRAGDVLE